MVEITHGDAGDNDAALQGALADGGPVDLESLVAQAALQTKDGLGARLLDQPVLRAQAAWLFLSAD